MSQNSILVRNISHLTDARYFAAMEVDWISMELSEDPLSFAKWHTLRDWISGLKLAAELKSCDESLIAKTIIDAKPDGIITGDMDIIHMTGGIEVFILTDKPLTSLAAQPFAQIIPYDAEISEEVFNSRGNESFLYLQADWTPDMIMDLKNKGYNGCICFNGAEETAIGIKDYEEMDRMIEIWRM